MRHVAFIALLLASAPGCRDEGVRDSVIDTSVDPGVWAADGRKVSAALPRTVGTFKPTEGADAFSTSFRTGPVFGGSCTYADGPRQLVVRVEGGNVRERATQLERGHANPGESFVTRAATVHGQKATVHWNAIGKTADVVYALDHRLLVELRLVPAASSDEVVQLGEAMDVAPLTALQLDGVR